MLFYFSLSQNEKSMLSQYSKMKRNEEHHSNTINLQASIKIIVPEIYLGTNVRGFFER